MMNEAFGGYRLERMNFLNGFSKLKNRVTLLEHAEIRDVCRRAKHMNVWIDLRNLSSKKEGSQSLKMLTRREFNLCKLRALKNSV
jgi:hypothetical protein